jgi:chemotaxis protein methyltransferase CheR
LTAVKIHEISQEGQQENVLWPQPTEVSVFRFQVSAQRTMDDHQFRKLLDRFGYSWAGYRKVRKGVKKRIARHMQDLECPTMDGYLELLASDDNALEQCRLRMTVSISRFFRDRQLWQGLQDRILPELLGAPRDFLRVWSAGCACGEEAYTFAILWDHLRRSGARPPRLELLASDVNPQYIAKAKVGVYPPSSLKEVPEALRRTYFDRCKYKPLFEIKAFLKEAVAWLEGDLFNGPPASGFHLILIRNNLLTYYQSRLVEHVFGKITAGLAGDGWLIVGAGEKPPEQSHGLIRDGTIPWAYRNQS